MKVNIESFAILGGFVLYLIAAISFLVKKNYAWALTWFCYAVANIGLIWASFKK